MHEHSLILELGLVFFFGFLGAYLAHKIGQSVIVGYIVLGTLIGPNVLGLVKEVDLIHTLAELGVVFLMFFLGLEFSISRFSQIKNSALIVGSTKILAQMGAGLLIGLMLGWSDIDRLFLAAIVAISSSGVTAKLLFDLKRTATRDAEVLMGVMVFEDFVAIITLGILTGIAVTGMVQVGAAGMVATKAILFYAAFIIVVAKGFPYIAGWLEQLDSDELFVAVIAGAVLLAAAGAVELGLPSAAGAFVLGMIINSKDLEERIHRKIAPFKDGFLVVFFLAFGMLINPTLIPKVAWLLGIVLAVSIFIELTVSTSVAFLGGLPPLAAVAVGTGLVSRGEYAMIYATVGNQTGAISPELYQLTGVYVFAMTLAAPLLMRNTKKIKKLYSFFIPNPLKCGLLVFSRSMAPLMFPDYYNIKVYPKRWLFAAVFVGYLLVVIRAFGITDLNVLVPLTAAGFILVWAVRFMLQKGFLFVNQETTEHLEGLSCSPSTACCFTLKTLTVLFSTALLISVFWGFNILFSVVTLLLFVGFLLAESLRLNRKQSPPVDVSS